MNHLVMLSRSNDTMMPECPTRHSAVFFTTCDQEMSSQCKYLGLATWGEQNKTKNNRYEGCRSCCVDTLEKWAHASEARGVLGLKRV